MNIYRLLDNAACASQERGLLIDDYGCEPALRQAVRLNVAEPLVQSATELLEACKRAAMQWRAYHQMHNEHDIEEENSEEGDCYRFVEAAISKAERA